MNLKTIRVLVVEDRDDDYRYLTCLLERSRTASYELEWATTYAAGLEALQRGGHNLGLFDYTLGGGTGIDLLREAQARGCEMPILLLTGHDSPEIDEAASAAGAVDFLCKAGLDHVQLERAIRYALRQAEMRAEVRKSQQQLELFMRNVPCAVGIRDEHGRMLFQNETFTRHFRASGDGTMLARTGSNEPWPCTSGDRHWVMNAFDMVSADGRHLQGFAAIDITARVEAENERRRTSQLLENITRSAAIVVGRIDGEGRVVEAQGEGLAQFGLGPAALLGRKFSELHPHTTDSIRQALAGDPAGFILSGRHDAVEWHVDFAVMPDGEHGGATFFGRDVTERRWLERRLLTISDAEQQRIGADLHDGLGQQLTGLAFLATAMRDRLKRNFPEEAEQAETIARLANDAVAQSRALARGLCPVQLEQAGLVLALEELAGQAQTLHGIECRFELRGRAPQCDHLTAMHLYRITQEAIHNAVRHGRAQHVRVTLASRRDEHRLSIEDDGGGFETAAHARAPGGGLRLMGYRAAMIGGTFSAESTPGQGTRITCHFTTYSTQHESDHRKTGRGISSATDSSETRQIAC